MKSKFNLVALFLLLLISGSLSAQISLTPYVTGLSVPVDIRNCGDSRLFVVEQVGRIRIIDSAGTLVATPFLDISSRVYYNGERGLLGLVFAPDYATDGYFYVNYTSRPSGYTTISRFRVSAANPNVADPNSEEILLTIYQPYSNHNGGSIAISPVNGYLYIGTGDGGSQNDPGNRGQNPDTLLGKLLRLQVASGVPGYSIPPTNPFAQDTTLGRPEIWGKGMRNPWRISFDRLNGDLWIGDVGQNTWEEVDLEPAIVTTGRNYGWRCYEGTHTFNTSGCAAASAFTPPVWEYQHLSGNCSVTGGYVYRGAKYADMYGKYFFTDYCVNQMRTLLKNGSTYTHTNLGTLATGSYVSFGEDMYGELYAADAVNGRIMRFTSTACNPVAAINGGLSDSIFTCGNSDVLLRSASGGGFHYSWMLAGMPFVHDYDTLTVQGNGDVVLMVTDPDGCMASDTVHVFAVPIPVAQVAGLDSIYCIDDLPVTLVTSPVGGNLFGDGINGLDFDPSLAGTGSHFITYTYSDAYGCSDDTTLTTTVDLCLEVYSLTSVENVVLYPNPANQSVTIKMPSRKEQETFVSLTDISGHVLKDFSLHLNIGTTSQELAIDELSDGLYFMKVLYEDGSQNTLKLLIGE